MTTSPGATPSGPIDFQQLRTAAAEAGGTPISSLPGKTTLSAYGREWPLVNEITPHDMIAFQDAQNSGEIRQLIAVMPRIVAEEHRAEFEATLWDENAPRIPFSRLLDEFNAASEAVAARPLTS